MKSVDEVQKLKVAELKQELQSRGLDTKGVKAVLVDRLLDAMVKEGGDFGNGGLVRPSAHLSVDVTAGSGEEDEDGNSEMETTMPQEGSPKRTTRGQSMSPVKTTQPIKSPTLVQMQKLPTSPKTTVVTPQSSPSKTPVSSHKVSPTPNVTVSSTPPKPVVSNPNISSTQSSAITPITAPEESSESNTSISADEPQAVSSEVPTETTPTKEMLVPESQHAESDSTKQEPSNDSDSSKCDTDNIKQAVGESGDLENKQSEASHNDAISQVDKTPATASDDVEITEHTTASDDVEMTEHTTAEPHKPDDTNKEVHMETENLDKLKRKHDDGEDENKEKEKEGKAVEQIKKIRLDQYSTVRVLPDDEPEFDEQKVLLDWYKSDLNIGISKDGFLKASPVVFEDFPWAYAGVKATHGFTTGRLAFEVKWIDNLDVQLDFGDMEAKHVLRIGWSDLHADLQLGEDPFSYGLGSDGKFYNAGVIQDLEEGSFAKGDTIAAFLDLESDPVEIKFSKNGIELAKSLQIPKSEITGKTFFPHILTRNTSFEVNFGESEATATHPILENFEFVTKVEETEVNKVRGPKAPKNKADCEFVMVVGMAGSGKTKWAKEQKASNLDKHFNIIGTSSVAERAVKKATLSSDNTPKAYESFLMKAARFVEKLVDLAPTRRRNYILDQSNVMTLVQRRKAAGFEGFKRRAVVILPNDEEYQKRIQAREQEQGKSVPKSTLLDMKASFRLPEVGETFSEVEFPELSKEECEELLKKYNKEAADAGYGQKPQRGGGAWYGHGQSGFRGPRGYRPPMGFRGPRRGGGGFRGGPPPFRFMRGDGRPPRYGGGPPRVPRDFTHRSYGPPRGGRGGPMPMPLIPRRADAPRSAWIRGVPPMNGRGAAAPVPRAYPSYVPRHQPYAASTVRGGYGASPVVTPRPQQSIWTTGQPGGGWNQQPRVAQTGYHPQQPPPPPQQADPWVQQVPDQGYGQSWGATPRGGGGGGTWQGYGGQTYGSYGRK